MRRMVISGGMLGAVCFGTIALGASLAVWGQQYPTKPVRVIVPFALGGGSDITARQVSQKFSEAFKRQFVVDNRGGAVIAT